MIYQKNLLNISLKSTVVWQRRKMQVLVIISTSDLTFTYTVNFLDKLAEKKLFFSHSEISTGLKASKILIAMKKVHTKYNCTVRFLYLPIYRYINNYKIYVKLNLTHIFIFSSISVYNNYTSII